MLDNLISPASEQVLKVTELTRQIKTQLEGRFTQIWVQGEVSNLRQQSSGHVYFSLKDAGSQLPCVLFARDAAQQSFQLENGMEVLLYGSLSVYAPHGRYQLITTMVIRSGQGRLQLEFERLKQKLMTEGLFDQQRKQPLPLLPMRIAVVTSPSGAAVRDFLRILRRRNYKGEVVIFPTRVQGNGAEKEIAAMLEYAGASKDFDLVVITRGGGSIEDLWAFNEEILARAVGACPLPVISAVGHEIDTVLTDYVADQRAETPSAAAELISSLAIAAEQRLQQSESKLLDWIETGISARRQSLDAVQAKMNIIAPERQVEMLGMKLDDLENQLSHFLQTRLNFEYTKLAKHSQCLAEHHPRIQINLARQALKNLDQRLTRAAKVDAQTKNEHLLHLQKRLENSSLKATLRRGYAVIKNTDGTIISSAQSGHEEDQLIAQLNDGEIALKVLKTKA
jgi:exodeoxyribonuclease VII large subunit